MPRVFNFSAGPATLPEAVLRQAQAEMLDWHGLGASIVEISHRSAEFMQVAERADADLRTLLAIPDSHVVLYLSGGATTTLAIPVRERPMEWVNALQFFTRPLYRVNYAYAQLLGLVTEREVQFQVDITAGGRRRCRGRRRTRGSSEGRGGHGRSGDRGAGLATAVQRVGRIEFAPEVADVVPLRA